MNTRRCFSESREFDACRHTELRLGLRIRRYCSAEAQHTIDPAAFGWIGCHVMVFGGSPVTDYRTWGDKLGHSLFHWAASVAEFRGAEIYLRNPREAELLGFMVLGRNTIVINFGKLMGDTGRSFHCKIRAWRDASAKNCGSVQTHGAEAGADPAFSEWLVAVAMLLHEWGHWELHRSIDGERYESDPDYKAAIEAEADEFFTRFGHEIAAREPPSWRCRRRRARPWPNGFGMRS